MLEMDIGLLYAIVAFVGCIIIGMILNRTLSTKYEETIDRDFCRVMIFFIFFCLIDGSWGLFFSTKVFTEWKAYGFFYEFFTYAFHAMAALSAFFWSGYMLRYVRVKENVKKRLDILRVVLLAAQWSILAVNLKNHMAFSFVDSAYIPGPRRKLLFWIQFSYYILIAVSMLIVRVRRKAEKTKIYQNALLFSLVPLLAGVSQLIYPDAPMYSIGFILSAVIIYAFNVTTQREAHLTEIYETEKDKLSSVISGLSEDFMFVFLVDMNTDMYDNFTHSGGTAEPGANRDFFAENIVNMRMSVYPDDYETVCRLLSKEHITEMLQSRKSFSFNYRGLLNGEINYNMIKVIRSDDESGKVIIGVFNDNERVLEEMRQQEHLRAAREQAELARRLEENNRNIIDVLGTVVEYRNLESGDHIQRVKEYTRIIAEQIMADCPEYGLTRHFIDVMVPASALHDVGKIAISDSILLKPGKLTAEEFEEMKTHTTKGCAILENIEGAWSEEYKKICYDICRHHHERFDGRGYPDGLSGDDIPIAAQIVSIADVYDALISKRVYKDAYDKGQAFEMIMNGECGVFSPKLLAALTKVRHKLEAEEYVMASPDNSVPVF